MGDGQAASTIGYRADIDGLRAVAILPVVAYHAGVPGVTGGFVGVDIFFVISGFLITSLLQREISENRFSIVAFYERRIRRILPALMVLLAVNFLITALIFLPMDFRRIPGASVAALAFASNVVLAGKLDYFAPDQSNQPLMHTWSLSVEEQYYVIFPMILMAIHRYQPKRAGAILGAIALWSLIYNVAMVNAHPVQAYFLTTVRMWEILAGALLALRAVPRVSRQGARTFLAFAGVAMIAVAVLAFTDETLFPGLTALLPVGGAVLVIHCAQGTIVGRLLGARAPVFIGLISYSLYLWHWPIAVWTQYIFEQPLHGYLSAYVLIATAICGIASWHFVEKPFRRARSRSRIFAGAAIGALAIAGIAGAARATNGWPGRYTSEALRLEQFAESVSPLRRSCHLGKGDEIRIRERCQFGARVSANTAVLGDSHGVELAWSLGVRAGTHGAAVLQMTYSSCPPGVGRVGKERRACELFRETALKFILDHPALHTIILVGHLDRAEYRDSVEYRAKYAALVEVLIRAGRHVLIVYPIPAQSAPGPRVLAARANHGWDWTTAGIPAADYKSRMASTLAFLDELPAVGRIRSDRYLCNAVLCRLSTGKASAYYDDNHLSLIGADIITQRIEEHLWPPTGNRAAMKL